jgi:hypothetical protein
MALVSGDHQGFEPKDAVEITGVKMIDGPKDLDPVRTLSEWPVDELYGTRVITKDHQRLVRVDYG